MLICDQYIAIRAVAGALPEQLRHERLAMVSAHWWLLLRAEARLRDPADVTTGQLGGSIRQLSPAARAELVAPRGDIFEVLDFREHAATAARVAQRFNYNWLVADLVGAAIHYRVALTFGSAQNVPPAIRIGSEEEPLVRYSVLQ